ncbi:MFS transporter [Chloroflexota bacterium]
MKPFSFKFGTGLLNKMFKRKVFYGWYIVGACLLISFYTSGIVNFGFTAAFEPIADEFGWSYAQISLAASIRGFEGGLLAPIMGIMVDRWGPRRLLFCGSILIFAGFVLMSRVSSLAMFYGVFALIAIGRSTTTNTVTMTAVGNWFRRKIGITTGIVASGVGLGGFLVPVVTGLIDSLQWRNAMLIVGFGMLVTVLPLSLLVRHKPEPYGYRPDGDESRTVEIQRFEISIESTDVSVSAVQALRTKAFWEMALASLLFMFVTSALMVHVMPYFSSLGIARSVSSLVVLSLPVTSIFGRLGSGWLSDRLNRGHIFTVSFALMSVSLFLFEYMTPARIWLVAPFIITYGFGWGVFATTRISLLREYFGRGSLGKIFGFASGIMMIGSIAGAPLVGWVFDTWGSYQGAWLGSGAIVILAMFLTFSLHNRSINIQLPDRSRTGTNNNR